MTSQSKKSGAERRFLFIHNQLNEVQSPREEAHLYRKLVTQVTDNIVSQGWDPLSGLEAVETYLEAAGKIVDDQKGINNYSHESLNNSDNYINHASKWKSGISLTDPVIQSFLGSQRNVDSEHDEDWERCLAQTDNVNNDDKPTSPSFKTSTESEVLKRNLAHSEDFKSVTGSIESIKKADFDLFDEDFMDTSEPQSNYEPRIEKKFSFNDLMQEETTDYPQKTINKHAPNFSFKSRESTTPPIRSAFVEKVWGRRAAAQPSAYQKRDHSSSSSATSSSWRPETSHTIFSNETPAAARNDFRTAAQQFNIDRAKKNESSGGINSSSYGTGKKQLGVKGPSSSLKSAFKPPVRSTSNENSCHAAPQSMNDESGTDVDPRYKNVDQKMVELIKNEIMDCGQRVEWDDIAGLEFAKETVKEIVVYPMLRPDIFTGLRGPPKGLLLFGPPGTGKTLIGKCIAHESNCTFFSISASSLTSKWVGEGEKMVRALFAVAKVHQPSVVFIDEIDSLLTSRSEGEHESSRKIKTEFLVQLDGANTVGEERVLVVGATNRPQELDDAARRRLVKRLYIPLPDEAARVSILSRLLGKERHDVSHPQLVSISQQTDGYSGSDMANLCREAAYGPIRSLDWKQIANVRADQVRPINFEDLVSAMRQVKASVSQDDLDQYIKWDKQFGASK